MEEPKFVCDKACDYKCQCRHAEPHPIHSVDPEMIHECDNERVCGVGDFQVVSRCVVCRCEKPKEEEVQHVEEG